MSFLQENKNKVMSALKYPEDKGMICIAMVNSAYPFCYDVTTVLGRYFHAQKEVATTLLTSKLSATYGTNRSLPNGLYCILPMLIEAGFITRPRAGVYQISHLVSQTDIAKSIYQKSFLANNPTLSEDYHSPITSISSLLDDANRDIRCPKVPLILILYYLNQNPEKLQRVL